MEVKPFPCSKGVSKIARKPESSLQQAARRNLQPSAKPEAGDIIASCWNRLVWFWGHARLFQKWKHELLGDAAELRFRIVSYLVRGEQSGREALGQSDAMLELRQQRSPPPENLPFQGTSLPPCGPEQVWCWERGCLEAPGPSSCERPEASSLTLCPRDGPLQSHRPQAQKGPHLV